MNARRWDTGLGLAFAVLGASLALAGRGLPDGLAHVPGPGFFPTMIGLGLAFLGLALAASARRPVPSALTDYWPHGWRDRRPRQVAAILALLAAYLALWDAVPFVWRTPLLLAGIYRTVGEPWLRSSVLAVSITALLVGVFDALLRVRL